MAPFKAPFPPFAIPEESYATFLLKNDQYPPDTKAYIDGISGETNRRSVHRDQVMALARRLRNCAVAGLAELQRGSTVLVLSPNSLLFTIVMLAVVSATSCGETFL